MLTYGLFCWHYAGIVLGIQLIAFKFSFKQFTEESKEEFRKSIAETLNLKYGFITTTTAPETSSVTDETTEQDNPSLTSEEATEIMSTSDVDDNAYGIKAKFFIQIESIEPKEPYQ